MPVFFWPIVVLDALVTVMLEVFFWSAYEPVKPKKTSPTIIMAE